MIRLFCFFSSKKNYDALQGLVAVSENKILNMADGDGLAIIEMNDGLIPGILEMRGMDRLVEVDHIVATAAVDRIVACVRQDVEHVVGACRLSPPRPQS